MLTERPVGTCPACGESVFNSREGEDGPVWTCPADLSEQNPYHEDSIIPPEQITKNEQEGFFGLCAEDCGDMSCYERMSLHAACYEKGSY